VDADPSLRLGQALRRHDGVNGSPRHQPNRLFRLRPLPRVAVGAPLPPAHFGWRPKMASHTMIARNAAAGPGGKTGFVARLLGCLPRLLAPPWPMFRFDGASPVKVVSHHGAVQIWETQVGLSMQPCVMGEPDRARTTALKRIAGWLVGSNRIATRLRAAGPLVQSEEAPGRWLVRVELPSAQNLAVAALLRNRRVRIRPAQPEVLAVLRMSERPAVQSIARGAAMIHAALADTKWAPAGGPMIRLYRPPSLLPFTNRFEVAVPIARCGCDARPQRTQVSSSWREPTLERGNTLSQPRGRDRA
jgi:hypothetical protein